MSTVEKAVDKLRGKADGGGRQTTARPAKPERELGNRKVGSSRASAVIEKPPALQIELARLRAAGMLPPEAMETRVSDEYRRIKRPLLANISGNGGDIEHANRLMVTSALAGEGKTFTSFNLALSLAQERDNSVVLIDGDVARPVVSRTLGLDKQAGLLDLLSDESRDPESLIIPTNWNNLSLLPSGNPRPLMTELLSSARMAEVVSLLERLPGGGRRILLFDSPPLLATSESMALAGAVGQIIMVVKAGQTLQQQVTGALESLDPSKAINLILNQSLRSHGANYYGGYDGYGYGYGYGYQG